MTRHPRLLPLPAVRSALVVTAVLTLIGAPMATANGIRGTARPAAAQPDPDVPRVPTVQADPAAGIFNASNVSIGLSPIASGFTNPVLVTGAGDGSGRLFVVQQGGIIRVIKGGSVLPTPFLDLRDRISTGGERGLLGLAFHPGFATHPYVYVDFTDPKGNTGIWRFTVGAGSDVASKSTAFHVLSMTQPYANHNGGNLAFGRDGFLYIGMGDGGGVGDPGNRAQNLGSYMGKLLRIDVDHTSGSRHYRSPSTNPFVGKTGLDEIWARGLRNPWRWSFDRLTGTLWVADVGQAATRRSTGSITWGPPPAVAAVNFGWSTMEGRACYKPASGCSTSGRWLPQVGLSATSVAARTTARSPAATSTGAAITPSSGRIPLRRLLLGPDLGHVSAGARRRRPPSSSEAWGPSPQLMISSFGEDDAGELYVCDWAGGGVYRITAAPSH